MFGAQTDLGSFSNSVHCPPSPCALTPISGVFSRPQFGTLLHYSVPIIIWGWLERISLRRQHWVALFFRAVALSESTESMKKHSSEQTREAGMYPMAWEEKLASRMEEKLLLAALWEVGLEEQVGVRLYILTLCQGIWPSLHGEQGATEQGWDVSLARLDIVMSDLGSPTALTKHNLSTSHSFPWGSASGEPSVSRGMREEHRLSTYIK